MSSPSLGLAKLQRGDTSISLFAPVATFKIIFLTAIADGTLLLNQVIRLLPGASSTALGMIDVDEILPDTMMIEGHSGAERFDIANGTNITIVDDNNLLTKLRGITQLAIVGAPGLPGYGWKSDKKSRAVTGANPNRDSYWLDPANLSNTKMVGLLEAVYVDQALERNWPTDMVNCESRGACSYKP